MNYTEVLAWLATVDWFREFVGTVAIVSGMIGKWKLGSGYKSGWVWGFVGSFFWFWFAVRIESPTGLINNIVYLLLSIRGYQLWKQRFEKEGVESDIT